MERTRTITWQDPMLGATQAMQMSGMEYLQAMGEGNFPCPRLCTRLILALPNWNPAT